MFLCVWVKKLTVQEFCPAEQQLSFYSISRDLTGQTKSKTNFYGYEWAKPQTIGLLGYHVGSVEEMGGWFNIRVRCGVQGDIK